jgi:hypothetical protein
MIRFFNTVILLFCCLLISSEPLFPEEVESHDQLVWEAWFIPVNIVSTNEWPGTTSARKPKAGFTANEGSGQWDATEFVNSMGIEKVPGAEATYDVADESLIVKNTAKNVATIGSVLSFAGLENRWAHIVVEFCVYECALAPDSKNSFMVWPSFADLAGKDSKSIRLVDRISGTTKSGHRSKYLRRTASDEQSVKTDAPKETSLGNQEPGIEAEVECVMAIDHYIDTNLSFRWRGQVLDDTTAALSFTTAFTSIENQPIVIQVASRDNSPGRYLVVTANFWRESSADWTLESLSKIAKKVREIEKHTTPLPQPSGQQSP